MDRVHALGTREGQFGFYLARIPNLVAERVSFGVRKRGALPTGESLYSRAGVGTGAGCLQEVSKRSPSRFKLRFVRNSLDAERVLKCPIPLNFENRTVS